MRGEDCVDKSRFAQTSLTYECQFLAKAGSIWRNLTDANDIELETALQELALDLLGYTVETNMTLGEYRLRGLSVCGGHCQVDLMVIFQLQLGELRVGLKKGHLGVVLELGYSDPRPF